MFRSRLFAAALTLLLIAPFTVARAGGPVFSEGGTGDQVFFGRTDSGYPTAGRGNWWEMRYSVDGFSRMHELLPSRRVNAPTAPWPMPYAATEPNIRYSGARYQGAGIFDVDGYLRRNPVTGLLIARLDDADQPEILVERYQYGRRETHRFVSFSMAKTFTSMLIGIALEEGHIRSLDDLAEAYVPGLQGSEYGRTPLRHLLTMSSGVKFREDYKGDDDSARLINLLLRPEQQGGAAALRTFNERVAEPGQRFYYASAETQVLGLVLSAATKRSVADYMEEKIWRPLGAEHDAYWVIDRSGQEITYAFLNASLRDYARFALMLANGGRAGGKQIVPETWIKAATKPAHNRPQTGDLFAYGYQTWVFPSQDGSFALLGVRGQMIFVDPVRRIVLVNTTVRPDARDAGTLDTIAFWFGVLKTLK